MTTENWREEFDKEFCIGIKGHTFGLGDWITDTTIKDFISTLLSKERNEAYEKGFTTGRQGVELACKEAMKLNYWDKEKRNEVIDEVRNEVEKDLQHDTFCKVRGEQFRECALCYVESKFSTLLENLKVK